MIRDWNVRRSERRATAGNGDWSTAIGHYGMLADEKVATG